MNQRCDYCAFVDPTRCWMHKVTVDQPQIVKEVSKAAGYVMALTMAVMFLFVGSVYVLSFVLSIPFRAQTWYDAARYLEGLLTMIVSFIVIKLIV